MDQNSIDQVIKSVEAIVTEAGKPSLIIIDTLSRHMAGGDENSAKDMGVFFKGCDLLKDTFGAAVLVVHHVGHGNKERARGSMAIKGALDFEMRADRTSEMTITLVSTKTKDAPAFGDIGFVMTEIEIRKTADGDPLTSLAASVGEIVKAEPKAKQLGPNQVIALEALSQLSAEPDVRRQTQSQRPRLAGIRQIPNCRDVCVDEAHHWQANSDAGQEGSARRRCTGRDQAPPGGRQNPAKRGLRVAHMICPDQPISARVLSMGARGTTWPARYRVAADFRAKQAWYCAILHKVKCQNIKQKQFVNALPRYHVTTTWYARHPRPRHCHAPP